MDTVAVPLTAALAPEAVMVTVSGPPMPCRRLPPCTATMDESEDARVTREVMSTSATVASGAPLAAAAVKSAETRTRVAWYVVEVQAMLAVG